MTTRAEPVGGTERPTEYRFDARSAGIANATIDLNRKQLTEALISTDRRLRETIDRLLEAEARLAAAERVVAAAIGWRNNPDRKAAEAEMVAATDVVLEAMAVEWLERHGIPTALAGNEASE